MLSGDVTTTRKPGSDLIVWLSEDSHTPVIMYNYEKF